MQALKNIDYPIRVYRVIPLQPGWQPAAERQTVPGPASSPGMEAFLRVSDQEREATVQRLQTAFAEGRLNDEEFDTRLRAALTARTQEELACLLADLSGAQARLAPARLMGRPVIAVLGQAVRQGRWRVPEQCTVVAVLGACVLDLRAAQLSAPVTTDMR